MFSIWTIPGVTGHSSWFKDIKGRVSFELQWNLVLKSFVFSSFLIVSQAAGLMVLKIASFDLQNHIGLKGKQWRDYRQRGGQAREGERERQ